MLPTYQSIPGHIDYLPFQPLLEGKSIAFISPIIPMPVCLTSIFRPTYPDYLCQVQFAPSVAIGMTFKKMKRLYIGSNSERSMLDRVEIAKYAYLVNAEIEIFDLGNKKSKKNPLAYLERCTVDLFKVTSKNGNKVEIKLVDTQVKTLLIESDTQIRLLGSSTISKIEIVKNKNLEINDEIKGELAYSHNQPSFSLSQLANFGALSSLQNNNSNNNNNNNV